MVGRQHALAGLPQGKRPGTCCTGAWVGLAQRGWQTVKLKLKQQRQIVWFIPLTADEQ